MQLSLSRKARRVDNDGNDRGSETDAYRLTAYGCYQ